MKKDDLIQKWLTNALSPEEKKAFERLEDASLNREIIEEAARFKANHNHKVVPVNTFLEQLPIPNTKKPLVWQRIMLQIAAVLIVGIAVFFFLSRNTITSFSTQIAEKQTIVLPDYSSVMLNAKSTITYDKKQWNTHRQIELNGEAFFDVEKGSTFDVITRIGTVSVLGTEFNVKQRDQLFEVYCYEGIVKVEVNNNTIRVPAGRALRFLNGAITEFSTTDTQPYWSNHLSKFRNAPIKEVFDELERQYNVTINSSDISPSLVFTGAFEHHNLTNALKAITVPLQLTYKNTSDHHITILSTARE